MFNRNLMMTVCAAAISASAFAQDVATTVTAEKNPPLKRTTIEVKPIESLISATPGIASGGASVEAYIGNNFAIKVGGSYADVDLPSKFVTTVNDEKNAPIVNKGYGFAADIGVRYYDYPIGNSLYGGLDVQYSEARNAWEFNDETYDTTRIAVTPQLVAGYRWVWQNGLMFRVGAGAGLPSVPSQKVVATSNGDQSEEGLKKIQDTLDQQVLAMIDLGLGVMF